MATKTAASSRKVVLWNVSTGERVERWPVDARAMVACGEFTATKPENAAEESAPAATPEPTPDPVPHVTLAAAVAGAMSPTGAPLVVGEAGEAKPVELPTERTEAPS